MPVNLYLQPQTNVGKVALRWVFREFKPVKRSRHWWIAATLVVVVLVGYAVWRANFLFALIILMGAVLVVAETRRNPRVIETQITTLGVVVGKKFWRWSEIMEFWIAYQPPEVANLYIVPSSWYDPRVTIPLEKINPLTARALVGKYVTENLDREDEPTSEALTRLFKLRG